MAVEAPSGVSMLHAFARDPALADTPQLTYPHLGAEAAAAAQQERGLMREFWTAEADTVAEEDLARRAAIGYLVLTGQQLQIALPEHQAAVAHRFTEATIELYGAPEAGEFQHLLHGTIDEFAGYASISGVDRTRADRVVERLRPFAAPESAAEARGEQSGFQEDARRLADTLRQRFSRVLAVFDGLDPEIALPPTELRDIYEAGRQILARQEPRWNVWSVALTDKGSLSAEAKTKRIEIGRNRMPLLPAKARQLFCHEVLVHAQRSVNGSRTGEAMMEYGMPGFLDAEEGLAVYIEYGLSGEIPAVRTDRYVDFGLALGMGGGRPLSRQQLHDLYTDRRGVRMQTTGGAVDEARIGRDGWRYVNRIYRGSLETGPIAVNTKDLAYHHGFLKIGAYVNQALAQGISAEDLLTTLLAGKYDPTNERHVQLAARYAA